MRHISFFLFLFALSPSLVHSESTDCPKDPFNPPADINNFTYYPSTFGIDPPLFPNNYNCTYQINVPKGYSAEISITVLPSIPVSSWPPPVVVTDQSQNEEVIYHGRAVRYFFLASGGSIEFRTLEIATSFQFSIRWYPMPSIVTNSFLVVGLANLQPLVLPLNGTTPYRIQADTKVSLLVTGPESNDNGDFLRSLIVYDGPDFNSPILGNAYLIWKSEKQLVATGKFMTFAALAPYYELGTKLMFQDFDNTKSIDRYQIFTCNTLTSCDNLSMYGQDGKLSAISTITQDYRGPDYLSTSGGTGTLEVRIGGFSINRMNVIQTYSLENSSSSFPQKFQGKVRTYVLNGGATLNITKFYNDYIENYKVGRKGFLASRYYDSGLSNSDQFGYEYVGAVEPVKYSFTIREADLRGSTTLNIVVLSKSLVVYNETFSSTNLPKLNEPFYFTGDRLAVLFQPNNQATFGYYMDFELLKASVVRNFSILALILTFYMFW